jgi:hypothetical protein
VNRSFSERLKLNHAILDNAYWRLPVEDKGHEDFMPVGRGSKASALCGSWRHFLVCDNVAGHEGVMLKGVDYTGKVVVVHEHLWCHRSSCPVCFIRGWSVREAQAMVARLEVASELGYGDVEHLTVSISPVDYGLSEEVMREKARRACLVRGVFGGGMIFHGYRMDRVRKVLVWSPHYHVLGFIRGGFDACRNCSHERGDCASCGGFKGREVREFANDKYLVKCFEKRKSVVGTAFYQLNHATIRVGLKRFHSVTYFGVCANSKLKSKEVWAVHVCPVCHSEMVKKAYWGKEHIVRDIGDPEYMKVFSFDQFDSSGLPNFVAVGGGGRVE